MLIVFYNQSGLWRNSLVRLLITGGTGFAGRFLCRFFYEKGYEITATYRTRKPQFEVEGVNYVHQELSECIRIKGQFDAIIHTACAQPNSSNKMEDYVRDNIDSARQLVKYAVSNRVGIIIYFSTRSVYGEIRSKEIRESDDLINPDMYGETKHIAEKIFQEAEGIKTIGFRLPGIIGPGAHDIWLADMARKIFNGESIEVSDFETKNLADILDIAFFIEQLISDASDNMPFLHDVVNISCKESINNTEIIDVLKKTLNSDAEVHLKKPGPGLFILNSDYAQEMGFVSSKPIDIVERYAEYFKHKMGN